MHINHNIVIQYGVALIPLLFAITLHEFAHGWIAYRCGDGTAKALGRLTLNPIKHIDLIGTILIPSLMLLLNAPFLFGWAKPVPVVWKNLKNPRRDMALVAAAGPLANLCMAVFWAGVAKFSVSVADFTMTLPNGDMQVPLLLTMAQAGIAINFILMLLNLLPIPPLDGSRIIASFFSRKIAILWNELEPYGFLVLVILLATGLLDDILLPILVRLYRLFEIIFHLS